MRPYYDCTHPRESRRRYENEFKVESFELGVGWDPPAIRHPLPAWVVRQGIYNSGELEPPSSRLPAPTCVVGGWAIYNNYTRVAHRSAP